MSSRIDQGCHLGFKGFLKNYESIAVSCVTGMDGFQQTFDGYLVGADFYKDLAVVRINAPKVSFGRYTVRRTAMKKCSLALKYSCRVPWHLYIPVHRL